MISLSEILFEGLNWKNRVDQYFNQPNTYVHFSDLPKLGINPQSSYDTPLGIYAYPFKIEKIASFAQNRKYMIIFKAKNPERVLDSSNYSYEEQKTDLEKLDKKYGEKIIDSLLSLSETKALVKTYAGFLWYITWKLSAGNIIKWNKIWREVLDYDGFSDEEKCLGIIHNSEPCQVVFWRLNDLEILDIIEKGIYSNFKTEYENAGDREFQKRLKLSHKIKDNLEAFKQYTNSIKKEIQREGFIYEFLFYENIKEEILDYLSSDENVKIRRWVARNSFVTSSIFEKLSKDEEPSVRSEVAKNDNAPIHVLIKLNKDINEVVGAWASINPTYIKYQKENGL